MTERERLIELLKNADEICGSITKCEECTGYGKGLDCGYYVAANYLLANDVMVLPVIPFGTELYQIYDGKIYKLKLSSYMIREINGKRILQWHLNDGRGFNGGGNVDEFGKTVFLTKEEAEQALKGGAKE